MEITCPHCNQPGITPMAKFRAMPKSPATCSYCGELSAIEQGIKIKVALFVAFLLMLIGPATYAFYYPSSIFMLFPLIIICCMPVATYYFVPLAPITANEIKHANLIFKAAAVLAVIYVIYEINALV